MHREFLFTPNMGFCPPLPSFPLRIRAVNSKADLSPNQLPAA